MTKGQSSRGNALAHVPACAAWPPPWLDRRAEAAPHGNDDGAHEVAADTPPGQPLDPAAYAEFLRLFPDEE
jgi:hypothetical protein